MSINIIVADFKALFVLTNKNTNTFCKTKLLHDTVTLGSVLDVLQLWNELWLGNA